MLEGAIVLAAGWLAGHVTAYVQIRRRKPKPPKPVQPICGCTHELAYHDPKTGECHATDQVVVEEGQPILDEYRSYVVARKGAKYDYRQCTCRRYTGPEPISGYYAPELTA